MSLVERLFGRSKPTPQQTEPDASPEAAAPPEPVEAPINAEVPTTSEIFLSWVADLDVEREARERARQYAAERGLPPLTVRVLGEPEHVVDLRYLPTMRLRITAIERHVPHDEVDAHTADSYLLVRERDPAHHPHLVAVYGRRRRIGHLTESKSRGLLPLLDALGADAYLVAGTEAPDAGGRLWVHAPKVPALRAFARDRAAEPESN
ncbi:hypothetical protein ARHIZOSPH14_27220 [Agromyces rhizosphaerae]|uniref:HIRAN domain-containing protein n=1 Tax=Agromyces rhizosphaerae TaxID=88374 RepID=A0A9W6CY62_9MICO|nr:hypothetical protein [Agromyces rhizosphaerae]GLI28480.1 hypothetical protein ARHIZOSPH14_27220 [Agromyces rhizosphaerae]